MFKKSIDVGLVPKECIQRGVLCSMFRPRKRPTKMEVWGVTARFCQATVAVGDEGGCPRDDMRNGCNPQ